jgi:hypothetical protein
MIGIARGSRRRGILGLRAEHRYDLGHWQAPDTYKTGERCELAQLQLDKAYFVCCTLPMPIRTWAMFRCRLMSSRLRSVSSTMDTSPMRPVDEKKSCLGLKRDSLTWTTAPRSDLTVMPMSNEKVGLPGMSRLTKSPRYQLPSLSNVCPWFALLRRYEKKLQSVWRAVRYRRMRVSHTPHVDTDDRLIVQGADRDRPKRRVVPRSRF